ncbi:MAG: hypothetical protein EBY24_00040 [Betaproteobacteria bacterium]|nr:hypothetical protein [Betaproteobacteria bacterium]
MSITDSTLSAVQQAGQSIDAARLALASAVQEQGLRVMAAVAGQPFSGENDKLFAKWKTVSRLAQEVSAIEEQFKAIHQSTIALVEEPTTLLVAMPSLSRGKNGAGMSRYEAPQSAAEDVPLKAGKGAHPGSSAPLRAMRKASHREPGLSVNDSLLLAYLTTGLNRKRWTRMTQDTMAEGSALARGSIGASLHRLLNAGRVLEEEKGCYKLP